MGRIRGGLLAGRPFELDLRSIRRAPAPGCGLWDGRDAEIPALKVAGRSRAVVVLLSYVAALRSCGLVVAAIVAAACTASTGLLILSPARQRGRVSRSGRGVALHFEDVGRGLAGLCWPSGQRCMAWHLCLELSTPVLRGLITFLACSGRAARPPPAGARRHPKALPLRGVLRGAASAVARRRLGFGPEVNTEPSQDDPSQRMLRRVAASLAGCPGRRPGRAERGPPPGLRPGSRVRVRGRHRACTAAALRLRRGLGKLDEAFGYRPVRGGGAVRVAVRPLNFALANNPRADGGFTTARPSN